MFFQPRAFIETRCLKLISSFRLKWGLRIAVVFVALALASHVGYADPLSFTISSSTLSAGPGDTVIFEGSVTNTSGTALNASDLFFNFSNYDAGSISDITQLLGTPDFALPNNTFSPVVDFFSVTLASTALPGPFSIDVSLEDINNDVSSTETATIVNASAVTPEPDTFLLCGSGVFCSMLAAYSSRIRLRAASCFRNGKES